MLICIMSWIPVYQVISAANLNFMPNLNADPYKVSILASPAEMDIEDGEFWSGIN